MKRTKPRKQAKPANDNPEVLALLKPIVAFLRRSGITEAELSAEFQMALKQAASSHQKVDITRIGATSWCADIVDRWLRDPSYVNVVGKPKDLPLTGKVSVSGLMKAVGAKGTPLQVVTFLSKFGTVKKTSKGTYTLVKRYMNYTVPGTLPYEPNMEFLVDAVAASTRGLGSRRDEGSMFWLRAQNTALPKKHVPEFLAYARQRSLVFLQEVDDWLEQHATSRTDGVRNPRVLRRVGIGLFPFCTEW
jgi:hypothetical protein